MTLWWVAASVLCAISTLPLWVVMRGATLDRLVALQVLTANLALAIVAITVANGRGFTMDSAVLLAVLSTGGGLTFARMLERWL